MLTINEVNEIIANSYQCDIWKQIASKENNIPYDKVSKEQRIRAKMRYFNVIYGGIR